jgi:hypothetical protein
MLKGAYFWEQLGCGGKPVEKMSKINKLLMREREGEFWMKK